MNSSEKSRPSTASRYLIGIAIGSGLALIGYFGYTTLVGSDQSRTTLPASVSEKSSPATVKGSAGSVDPNSDFGSDLRELTQYPSEFARSAALYELLEKSNRDELIDLSNRSVSIEHPERRWATQNAIGQRIASIDPHKALETVMKLPVSGRIGLLTGIYQEWSVSNLDNAISSAQSLDKASAQQALQAILQTRIDLSVSLRLEIAAKFGREEFAIGLITEESMELHAGKPDEAWQALLEDGLDNAYQLRELRESTRAWAERDGFVVLARIFDGFSDPSDRNLQSEIVRSVVEIDARKAFEYVSSLPTNEREGVLRAVVRAWARTEPQVALEAIAAVKPPSEAKSLFGNVVNVWAGIDPYGILDSLDQFDAEGRLVAAEQAVGAIGRNDPEDAARIIEEIKDSVGNTSSLEHTLMYHWSKSDPLRSVDWVLEDSERGGTRRRSLMKTAIQALAHEDPQRAFQIGLQQPLRFEHDSGMESDVILELSGFDIETAIDLLPNVRETSKGISYLWVGRALVEKRNPHRALELAAQVPDSRRVSYYEQIASQWALTNPIQLFEELDQFVDKTLKSTFAKKLILNNSGMRVLSAGQIDHVKLMLTEDDAMEVGQ